MRPDESVDGAMDETLVDARARPCPHPVLELRAALAPLPAGALVTLLASDPLAPLDVAAYCLRAHHTLVSQHEESGGFRFVIRRG
jgi:tRNA 2-thiouridine synthesizing protein A